MPRFLPHYPILLLLAFPMAAAAQEARRADELHDQAGVVLAQPGGSEPAGLAAASRLHLRSAVLRRPDDPQAEACIAEAARLLQKVDPARASTLLELSAQRAEARGDARAAVSAYLDAAHLATGRDRITPEESDRARALLARVQRLAASPAFTAEDRARVVARARPLHTRVAVRNP